MAKRVYKDTYQNRKLGRVGKEIPSKAKAPAKEVKKRVKEEDAVYDVEGRKNRARVKSTKRVDSDDDDSTHEGRMKPKNTKVKPPSAKKAKSPAKAKPPAKKEEKKAPPKNEVIKGVSSGTMEAYKRQKAKREAEAKRKANPPKKIAEDGKRGDAKYNEEYSKQLMKKRALQKEVKTKVPKYLKLKEKLGANTKVDKDGRPIPAPRKKKEAPVPAPRKKKERPVPKPRPTPKPPSYNEIVEPTPNPPKKVAKAKKEKKKAKAKVKEMKPQTPAEAEKFALAILGPEDERSESLDQQIERKFAEHKILKKTQNQKPKPKSVEALLPDKSYYLPPKLAKTSGLANPPSQLGPPKENKKKGLKSLKKSRSNLKKKLKKEKVKIKIGPPKEKKEEKKAVSPPPLTERKGKKQAVKTTELKGVGGKGGGLPPVEKKEKKDVPLLVEKKEKKKAVKTTELKGVGGKGGGVPPIDKKTLPSRVKKARLAGVAEKPKELSATELYYKGDDAGAKAKRLKDASAFNKLYGGNTAKAKQTEDEEKAYFSKLYPNPNYKPPPPKPKPGKARNLDYPKLKVSHLKLLNDAEKARFRKLIVKRMDADEPLTKAMEREWAGWLKTQGGFK